MGRGVAHQGGRLRAQPVVPSYRDERSSSPGSDSSPRQRRLDTVPFDDGFMNDLISHLENTMGVVFQNPGQISGK
jgi:hypothetical protein